MHKRTDRREVRNNYLDYFQLLKRKQLKIMVIRRTIMSTIVYCKWLQTCTRWSQLHQIIQNFQALKDIFERQLELNLRFNLGWDSNCTKVGRQIYVAWIMFYFHFLQWLVAFCCFSKNFQVMCLNFSKLISLKVVILIQI